VFSLRLGFFVFEFFVGAFYFSPLFDTDQYNAVISFLDNYIPKRISAKNERRLKNHRKCRPKSRATSHLLDVLKTHTCFAKVEKTLTHFPLS